MSNLPQLKLYQCGCTSGHDSLIQLWIPVEFTADDLDQVDQLWNLMLRQFRRSVEKKLKADTELPTEAKEE